jgi:hypothetical protein
MHCAFRVFDNSTAMYNDPKTLHPGGIRTGDLLFCRRARWPLHTYICCTNRANLKFSQLREHLKRTQFWVETCCANKVWKNLIALVIGECVCENFFTFGNRVDWRLHKRAKVSKDWRQKNYRYTQCFKGQRQRRTEGMAARRIRSPSSRNVFIFDNFPSFVCDLLCSLTLTPSQWSLIPEKWTFDASEMSHESKTAL